MNNRQINMIIIPFLFLLIGFCIGGLYEQYQYKPYIDLWDNIDYDNGYKDGYYIGLVYGIDFCTGKLNANINIPMAQNESKAYYLGYITITNPELRDQINNALVNDNIEGFNFYVENGTYILE